MHMIIPLSISSCQLHWHHYLKPKQERYKEHDWTLDEVMLLIIILMMSIDYDNNDGIEDDNHDDDDSIYVD